jgi:hypothetical protein
MIEKQCDEADSPQRSTTTCPVYIDVRQQLILAFEFCRPSMLPAAVPSESASSKSTVQADGSTPESDKADIHCRVPLPGS